jgi:Cu-processing system ATP-binding protein
MVEVEHLTKRFGTLEVLKGIDARFEPGRVTAVVGPNASGKTTLMKSILGLVVPDAGQIRVNGERAIQNPRVRAQIGYMPQDPRFPENVTGREVIRWIQELRGGPGKGLDALIEEFALAPALAQPTRVLSGGTRQKLSAVLAFLFDPPVLILDEPTAGLDPLASSRFKDRILAERARGKTIIMTSHVMSELEELADRVLFLLEGTVIFFGELEALREKTGEAKLERAVARLMEGA